MKVTMQDLARRLVFLDQDVADCLAAARTVAERAALKMVRAGLRQAMHGTETEPDPIHCPVCGAINVELICCRWCGGQWCKDGDGCESGFHTTPGKCQHAPQPEAPQFAGEPEDDIIW